MRALRPAARPTALARAALIAVLAALLRWLEPDRQPTSQVDLAGILTRHLGLGLLIAGSASLLQAPALAYATTYMLLTGAGAASLLPNLAERIRHAARANSVYVAACAIPIKIVLSVLQHATPAQLSGMFGDQVSASAHAIATGILPSIYFFALASVPLGWTGWLIKCWTLSGRTDDYEASLRRARREDPYQH